MTALKPLGGSSAERSFAYYGERADWLVALGQHRDSDDVERSNWECITEHFEQMGFGNDWAIERFSNWLVGWNEVLLVKPGTPAAEEAQRIADRLANYPVYDDEHLSMLEYDEQWCVRCDRGTRQQHRLDIVTRCGFRNESEAHEIRWKWDQRAEARRARVPILTVTCNRCGEQVGGGLVDFENHARAHEFGGTA